MQTPQETPQGVLSVISAILPYLGLTTLTGAIALYVAWLKLPPKLTIDAVIDKSKKFNSESRLNIKNIGHLAAWNIRADLENANAKIAGVTMSGNTVIVGPNNTHLSPQETTELPVLQRLIGGPPMHLSSCDYVLNLKYEVHVLFFKKELQRKWHVELRNYDDGSYAWTFTMV